jgi:hypothetical protein
MDLDLRPGPEAGSEPKQQMPVELPVEHALALASGTYSVVDGRYEQWAWREELGERNRKKGLPPHGEK